MHRSLILATALALPMLAQAQPPAPVGGDMSNTTTKATGGSAARKLADRAADWLNPLDFGAIGDGTSHPLSSKYASLAAAQAVCPEATSLTQEIDWCAMQAAIDVIAARPVVPAVPYGTPGGNIRIPAGVTLKLGTTSLVANRMSLTIKGEDQWGSVLLAGANPMLAFGLSNGMGIGNATVSSTGTNFVPGEVLSVSGGTCSVAPQITVNTVGASGEILTQAITNGGNCSVIPSNPLAYSTSGIGYGAQFNGTFTGSAMTGAVVIAGTGTGCVNGEILTGTGGSTPNGTPTQFQLTVTNAVGGVVQKGGVSITNPGSYGTPPLNPVPVTGSAACVGAQFNIGALTNNGGSLTMEMLQLIADAPGASVVTAQFNLPNRSTILRDLQLYASGTNYFSGGFDLMSMSNSVISRIDSHNNVTYLNSNPSNALFIVRQQNTLLGHFEHYWDHINAYAFMGGAIDYLSTAQDTVPFQGQKFERVGCSLGLHCLRLENTGTKGYGNVLINDLYGTQNTQQIEIKTGLGIVITNSNFGPGQTRITSPPSQADMVVLDSVNQWIIRSSYCSSALVVTPSITCFHIKGTSAFGIASGNIITNPAKVPTFNGYVFDAGATLNQQSGDYFGANVTSVTDSGSNNTTILTPPVSPACVLKTLAAAESYTIPDGTSCVFFNNTLVASATVIMPANPATNQTVGMTWFGGVTTLTVQANTGQTLGGAPTTSTQSTPFTWKYISGRWQRV